MLYLLKLLEIDGGAIVCRGNEHIIITTGSPCVLARDHSSPCVLARDQSSPRVEAWDHSSPRVSARDHSSPYVEARDHSSPCVVACDQSSPYVEARDHSSPYVVAWDQSFVNTLLLGNENPRGYCRSILFDGGEVWFMAGCRKFTFAEARAHWGDPEYPNRVRGDEYLRLIDYAEGEAHARGWIKD